MPRRARIALTGAAAGVVLLALTWFVSHYVGIGKQADASILRGFADLTRPRLDRVTNFIAHLCNPDEYVFLAAVPVAVALVRRRPRVAAMIALVLLCANETTQLLKPLLAGPRDPVRLGSDRPRVMAQRARHRRDVPGPVRGDRRAGAAPSGRGGGDGGVCDRRQLLVPGARLALPVRCPRRLPGRRHVDPARHRRPVDPRGASRRRPRRHGAGARDRRSRWGRRWRPWPWSSAWPSRWWG